VEAETWGCGYAYPTPRMACTGSSFAQILTTGFRWALLPRIRFSPPRGPFPASARFSTEPREAVLELALLPAVRDYISATSRVRHLIAGRLHLQALLVLATLIALLAWRLLWW
jgi:hydrogenase-4 component B